MVFQGQLFEFLLVSFRLCCTKPTTRFKDLFLWEVANADTALGTGAGVTGAGAAEKPVYGEMVPVLAEVFGRVLPSCTIKTAARAGYGRQGHRQGLEVEINSDIFAAYDTFASVHAHVLSADKGGDCGRGSHSHHSLFRYEQLHPETHTELVGLSDRLALESDSDRLQRWSPLVGMVHGDLNGSNILIDAQSEVWLIDFAKSRRAHVAQKGNINSTRRGRRASHVPPAGRAPS